MKTTVDIEVGSLRIKDVLALTPAELGSFITGVMAYYSGAEAQEFYDNVRDPDFQSAVKKRTSVNKTQTVES